MLKPKKQYDHITVHIFCLKILHKETDNGFFMVVSNSNRYACDLCFFSTHVAKWCLPEVSFGIGERCCKEQGYLKDSCTGEASRRYKILLTMQVFRELLFAGISHSLYTDINFCITQHLLNQFYCLYGSRRKALALWSNGTSHTFNNK